MAKTKKKKAKITGTKKVSKKWKAAPLEPEKLNVNSITGISEYEMIQRLHTKILEIMLNTTFLDCHNEADDGEGGIYHYTEISILSSASLTLKQGTVSTLRDLVLG